jgi:hypothetical protein
VLLGVLLEDDCHQGILMVVAAETMEKNRVAIIKSYKRLFMSESLIVDECIKWL